MKNRQIEEFLAELPSNEMDWTHTPYKKAPKRPWRCPHCPAHLAFEWTWKKHIAQKHEPFLPHAPRAPGQRTGLIECTSCTARYDTEPEMTLHRAAKHRWLPTD